jgi:hypothetical protein
MKEINSFFEEPQNYIFKFILTISSFSGFLFLAIKEGLKLGYADSPKEIFYGMLFIYIGIPALLPFYHLLISGRDRPMRSLLFVIAGVLGAIIIIASVSKYYLIIGLSIWIIAFIWMFSKGRNVKLSSDSEVYIKENTIIELFLIIFSLLLMGIFFCYQKKDNFFSLKPDDICKTFTLYKASDDIKDNVRNLSDLIELPKKIYESDKSLYDSSEKFTSSIITPLEKMANPQDNLLKKNIEILKNYSNRIKYDQTINQLRINQIKLYIQESNFAENFANILKHYQAKGFLMLVLTALLLLFVWFHTVEKEELSNRIRAHFFVVVTLILPLLSPYDKEDITIEKPFGSGFSKANEKSKGEKWIYGGNIYSPIIDNTTYDFTYEMTDDQYNKLAQKVQLDSLQMEIKYIDKRVLSNHIELLDDKNYRELLNMITNKGNIDIDTVDYLLGKIKQKHLRP